MSQIPKIIVLLFVVFVTPLGVWQVVKYRALAVDLTEENAALKHKMERVEELREQALLLQTLMRMGLIDVPAVVGDRRLVLRSCGELYDQLYPDTAFDTPLGMEGNHVWAGIYCAGHWADAPDRVFTVVAIKRPIDPPENLNRPRDYVFKPQEDREP